MKNHQRKHLGYYFSLFIILALGTFLVIQSPENKVLQMMIVVMMVFFYVLWGILHHFIHHDLKSKIVIEYVLIGSLGMAVVLLYLKGIV